MYIIIIVIIILYILDGDASAHTLREYPHVYTRQPRL